MADDVRTVWEQRSGLSFDPWADLASIIGTLDSIRGRRDPNAAMWTIEAALKAAVSDAQLTPRRLPPRSITGIEAVYESRSSEHRNSGCGL